MAYPGRRLPYEVRFGAAGETPPNYVARIDADKLVLQMQDGTIREIEFERDDPFHVHASASLFEALRSLLLDGFALTNDPKDYHTPGSLMLHWQEVGKWVYPFPEISWWSKTQWVVTTIPPPEIGVRGWQGERHGPNIPVKTPSS